MEEQATESLLVITRLPFNNLVRSSAIPVTCETKYNSHCTYVLMGASGIAPVTMEERSMRSFNEVIALAFSFSEKFVLLMDYSIR